MVYNDRHNAPARWFVVVVNILMVLYLIGPGVSELIYRLHDSCNYYCWGVSDLLVNYQGGFMRRGLLGELIYRICSFTGWEPMWVIVPVCLAAFAFVALFILAKFRQYGIRWWLLGIFLVVMLSSVLRKDFFMFVLYIFMLFIYNSHMGRWGKFLMLSILSVVMVLSYEPTYFLFLVLMSWMVLSDRRLGLPMLARALYVLGLMAVMVANLIYTGNPAVPEIIHRSWCAICPAVASEPMGLSLDAMRWSVTDSLAYNESVLMPGQTFESLLVKIAMLVVAPYIYIRYTYVVVRSERTMMPCDFNLYSSLVVFLMLCLTPLWLGLSCDFGRLIIQVFVTAWCTVFILPESTLRRVIPQWWVNLITSLNRLLGRIPCNFYTITLLMLVVVVPYSHEFEAIGIFKRSVLWSVALWLKEISVIFINHF